MPGISRLFLLGLPRLLNFLPCLILGLWFSPAHEHGFRCNTSQLLVFLCCLKISNPVVDISWPNTPPKTNMAIEKQPFEDVSPMKNSWFSIVMFVFFGGYTFNLNKCYTLFKLVWSKSLFEPVNPPKQGRTSNQNKVHQRVPGIPTIYIDCIWKKKGPSILNPQIMHQSDGPFVSRVLFRVPGVSQGFRGWWKPGEPGESDSGREGWGTLGKIGGNHHHPLI